MRIGIFGAGMIGATLGPLWMRAGHAVRFGTRHPDRVRVEGALATTVAEAASAASAAGSALEGKVVLDATDPMAHREPAAVREIEAEGTGPGRWVARHLGGARVVKAFDTVYFRQLRFEFEITDNNRNVQRIYVSYPAQPEQLFVEQIFTRRQ